MFNIRELDVHELNEMRESGKDLILLDVRTPQEVAQGIIPGATHLPLHLLPLQLKQLDRQQEVIFYCRTGARSAQACAFCQNQGSDNVLNLRGGIVAWARAGYPIGEMTNQELTF
ncbi:MAG: rhodanese-like domain-containing protein [Gammaproteobacteria bacterium]|nr:rhodanese-like domain-containing protein [Gammaproteobacteria bacterium]